MTYSRTKRWQAELKQVLGSEQWHCPAGCKLGASECARARFRLQCLCLLDFSCFQRRETRIEEEREDFLSLWNGRDAPSTFGTPLYGRSLTKEYTWANSNIIYIPQ